MGQDIRTEPRILIDRNDAIYRLEKIATQLETGGRRKGLLMAAKLLLEEPCITMDSEEIEERRKKEMEK